MAKPRFNLADQVAKLGADSLLPPAKPLTGKIREEFFTLIRDCGSPVNGTRVMARLHLRSFQMEHGEDRCQVTYDNEMAKRK
jgi:hypothetical protein